MQLEVILKKKNSNSRNNVFKRKQRRNKVPPKIFRGFEVRKKTRLMVWKQKDTMKSKCYVFSGYKQRNKVFLVYLECKLQEDSYDFCIFKI